MIKYKIQGFYIHTLIKRKEKNMELFEGFSGLMNEILSGDDHHASSPSAGFVLPKENYLWKVLFQDQVPDPMDEFKEPPIVY